MQRTWQQAPQKNMYLLNLIHSCTKRVHTRLFIRKFNVKHLLLPTTVLAPLHNIIPYTLIKFSLVANWFCLLCMHAHFVSHSMRRCAYTRKIYGEQNLFSAERTCNATLAKNGRERRKNDIHKEIFKYSWLILMTNFILFLTLAHTKCHTTRETHIRCEFLFISSALSLVQGSYCVADNRHMSFCRIRSCIVKLRALFSAERRCKTLFFCM